MSNKTITLDDIPVTKELVEDTIDASTQILPLNAKVVYCNGDHDELKIQAAIEAIKDTGGVVYPVGNCKLETGLEGESIAIQSWPVASKVHVLIQVPEGITVDGRYADFTLAAGVQTIEGTAYYIAFVGLAGSVIRNINMTEDKDSFDTAGVRYFPIIAVGRNCTYENFKISGFYGVNGIPGQGQQFNFEDTIINNMVIDNLILKTLSGAMSEIKAVNCKFDRFSLSNVSKASGVSAGGDLITTSNCTFTDVHISGIDYHSYISLTGVISGVVIENCNNCKPYLSGIVSNVYYRNITNSEYALNLSGNVTIVKAYNINTSFAVISLNANTSLNNVYVSGSYHGENMGYIRGNTATVSDATVIVPNDVLETEGIVPYQLSTGGIMHDCYTNYSNLGIIAEDAYCYDCITSNGRI